MDRIISKLVVAIITGTLLLGSASDVFAQRNKDKSTKKTKETVAMSQAVYEDLTEIQELVETKIPTTCRNATQTPSRLTTLSCHSRSCLKRWCSAP